MQCGCPQCGLLMTQQERGIESACRCPNCAYSCSACLGTNSMQKKGEYSLTQSMLDYLAQYGQDNVDK